MPGEVGGMPQDLSGIDDVTAQLMLKRRLAQADALRQSQMPQGQMVSGHYIKPHWTQQLAALGNQALGAYQEGKAMKEYGDYQKARQAKMADLLSGKTVEQPVDYNEAGNMPGMTETTRQPYSQQEFMAKAIQAMPEMADDLVKAQIAQYGKEEQPISLSEGARLVNRKGELLAENPKSAQEKSAFGNVSPSDFTPQSLAKFAQTKNFADLVPVPKQATPAQPYFQAVPTAQGYARFNARTGQMETLPLNGQAVMPAAQSPQLQGQIAGAKFEGEAGAKRAFNMSGASDIVNNARSILQGKTPPTGSGVGTIVDTAGAIVGYTPKGAPQADQLRAIGGQLVAKMPRMEGPQSDRDVQLYTQMAGQIGDSTIPVKRRLEALKTVEGIIQKYEPKQQSQGRTIVRTGTDKVTGRKVVQYSDGTTAYAE